MNSQRAFDYLDKRNTPQPTIIDEYAMPANYDQIQSNATIWA